MCFGDNTTEKFSKHLASTGTSTYTGMMIVVFIFVRFLVDILGRMAQFSSKPSRVKLVPLGLQGVITLSFSFQSTTHRCESDLQPLGVGAVNF